MTVKVNFGNMWMVEASGEREEVEIQVRQFYAMVGEILSAASRGQDANAALTAALMRSGTTTAH